MANLKSLRNKIKNIIDYAPDLQVFNDQVDDIINDAYLSIWTEKRWNFARKEAQFDFHPDITPNRDDINGIPNANVQPGSRYVTLSVSVDRLNSDWEGQPIEIQGREYIISKVMSKTEIILTEPFRGSSNSDELNWLIKYRWYYLPSDVSELLYMGMRDYPFIAGGSSTGKMFAIENRPEESFNLRVDKKGENAEAYIWGAPINIPAGEKTVLTQVVGTAEYNFDADSSLEVCWAFEKAGQYGPLSEPDTIKFGGVGAFAIGLKVGFVSWDDQEIVADSIQLKDMRPTQHEGLRKVIFWNANYDRQSGERLGKPKWKHFNKAGTTRNLQTYLLEVIADDTEGYVECLFGTAQIDSGNKEYIEYDGQILTFRTYPRVDGFDMTELKTAGGDYPILGEDFYKQAIIRYLYKPKALTMSTDSPEMPYEFHQLIVFKALEDVYLKLGSASMANTYRKRIDKEIDSLRKRYIDRIDVNIQRGQFQSAGSQWAMLDYSSLRMK